MRIAVIYSDYTRKTASQGFWLFAHDLVSDVMKEHVPGVSFDLVNVSNLNLAEDYEPLFSKYDVAFGVRGMDVKTRQGFRHHQIPTVAFWDDIHYNTEQDLANRKALFRDLDLILLPCLQHFYAMDEYREYYSKAIMFPFFAPLAAFINNNWNEREDKVLLSGRMTRHYSFRRELKEFCQKYPGKFDILGHPGYYGPRLHDVIGVRYYEKLASYKGAIASSADYPLDYLVRKYFEVCAAGCVPYFDVSSSRVVRELDHLGFKSYEHYIPIYSGCRLGQLGLDLFYKRIADAARVLVGNKHSSIARAKELVYHIKDKFFK